MQNSAAASIRYHESGIIALRILERIALRTPVPAVSPRRTGAPGQNGVSFGILERIALSIPEGIALSIPEGIERPSLGD
jgi:hypothetical protein